MKKVKLTAKQMLVLNQLVMSARANIYESSLNDDIILNVYEARLVLFQDDDTLNELCKIFDENVN